MTTKEEAAPVFGRFTNLTKIEKYGWTVKDELGIQMMINKNDLYIPSEYQRTLSPNKVSDISTSWSWIACAVIVVGFREGRYWVIDGQHRVMAAMKRADILELPCIVFQTKSISQEARGFLDINAGRKSVSSVDKFKALIQAEDETAVYVRDVLQHFGIEVDRNGKRPKSLKSVYSLMRQAKENRSAFEAVIRIVEKLCYNSRINHIVLEGLFYLHKNCNKNLNDVYMRNRLLKIGNEKLLSGARKAASFFETGGPKVYAEGMLNEVNKGIRNKMYLMP